MQAWSDESLLPRWYRPSKKETTRLPDRDACLILALACLILHFAKRSWTKARESVTFHKEYREEAGVIHMTERLEQLQELARFYQFGEGQGFLQTVLPGVRLFRTTTPVKRAPLLYQSGIVIIGQGHKIGYLDGESFRYDPEHYLVVSVPMPFECETFASPEEPMLGLFLDIDVPTLQELLLKLGDHLPAGHFDAKETLSRGIEPVLMGVEMEDATLRLLRCLCSSMQADVLGPSIVHELMFHVLLGQHGQALYQLTQHHSQYARIARALSKIHDAYSQPLQVEELAREAAMSQSAFYRTFKRVTGDSPLQYLKKVRLNKAKSLLLYEGEHVRTAAYQVGYESPSQFSREFKRYFQISPVEVRHHNTGHAARFE